jgi:hypothetical protein
MNDVHVLVVLVLPFGQLTILMLVVSCATT